MKSLLLLVYRCIANHSWFTKNLSAVNPPFKHEKMDDCWHFEVNEWLIFSDIWLFLTLSNPLVVSSYYLSTLIDSSWACCSEVIHIFPITFFLENHKDKRQNRVRFVWMQLNCGVLMWQLTLVNLLPTCFLFVSKQPKPFIQNFEGAR